MEEHAKVEHFEHTFNRKDGCEAVVEQTQLLVSERKKHDDKQDEYDDDDDVDEPFAVLLDRIFEGKGDAAQQYHKHDEAVKERTSHKPMQVDSNPETKVSSFILKIDISVFVSNLRV